MYSTLAALCRRFEPALEDPHPFTQLLDLRRCGRCLGARRQQLREHGTRPLRNEHGLNVGAVVLDRRDRGLLRHGQLVPGGRTAF